SSNTRRGQAPNEPWLRKTIPGSSRNSWRKRRLQFLGCGRSARELSLPRGHEPDADQEHDVEHEPEARAELALNEREYLDEEDVDQERVIPHHVRRKPRAPQACDPPENQQAGDERGDDVRPLDEPVVAVLRRERGDDLDRLLAPQVRLE